MTAGNNYYRATITKLKIMKKEIAITIMLVYPLLENTYHKSGEVSSVENCKLNFNFNTFNYQFNIQIMFSNFKGKWRSGIGNSFLSKQ